MQAKIGGFLQNTEKKGQRDLMMEIGSCDSRNPTCRKMVTEKEAHTQESRNYSQIELKKFLH